MLNLKITHQEVNNFGDIQSCITLHFNIIYIF